ncbi:MAG: hypothetical protein Q9174_005159 [Haloplaca sp. 1 TL-2023]
MSTYKYEKLDPTRKEIRICTIHPGAFDDPIHCSLLTVSLDDNPKYETLSYAWGPPLFDHEILVNGSILKVTKNLHNAVRYIRCQERLDPNDEDKSSSNDASDREVTRLHWDPEASGVLWADAVCINQADIDERSSQIGFMGDIYRRSGRLHIWIGTVQEIRDSLNQTDPPETEYDADYVTPERLAEARAFFLDAGLTAQQRPLASAAYADEDADVNGALEILQLFAEDKHAYELPLFRSTGTGIDLEKDEYWHKCIAMLLGILTQPWWTRVWVVQEVLLSSTSLKNPVLHIGHHRMPLAACDSFRFNSEKHMARCCFGWIEDVFGNYELMERHWDAVTCLASLKHLQELHKNRMVKLSKAYDSFSSREAADPHDHIYGFLALIKDFPTDLQVDYTTPVSQLYTVATKTALRERGSLDFLDSSIGTGRQNRHGLPSWCFDWSEKRNPKDSLFEDHRFQTFNAAPGWTQTMQRDCEGGNILLVDAIPVGTVGFVNSVIDDTGIGPVHHVLHWMEAIGRQDLGDIKTVVLVLMRDLYSNVTDQILMRISTNPDLMSMVMDLAKFVGSHKDWLDQRFADNRLQSIDYHMGKHQRLFITNHGRLASGLPDTREGDRVFVAKGSVCPLVLRPLHNAATADAQERAPNYQFVGRCYVHGIMDGEAVTADTEWQSIRLI